MQAITVRDRDAGVGGLSLTDMPDPRAGQSDVIVRVCAAGFTPGELAWPTTWVDRTGGDRTGPRAVGVVTHRGRVPTRTPGSTRSATATNPARPDNNRCLLDEIKILGMSVGPETLPGTVARTGDKEAIPPRNDQIASIYRER